MPAVMLQVLLRFYAKFREKNNLFIPATACEIYSVSRKYCIAHHDAEMCFSTSCKYHSLVLGKAEELLPKLDPLCFTNQHMGCFYKIFKYRFMLKNVVKRGQVFDFVRGGVYFNQRNRGVNRMAIIAKKTLLRKRNKKYF